MKKIKKVPKTMEGLLNTYIDKIFHPSFEKDKMSIIIDTSLHFIVEQNLQKSMKKFVRYSLKHLIVGKI